MMHGLKWAMVLWLGLAQATLAAGVEQGLVVTGEGSVAAEPDMAMIALGVTTAGTTAAEAMQENAATVSDILSALDDLGIAAKDRQTSRFYLRPVWSNRKEPGNGEARITGYEAGNSISVRVRDLGSLGQVLDGVIALGGNEFNGLSFGLQDDTAQRSAARRAAVKDAMARASELAEAAGLKLGNVLRLSEEGGRGGPVMMESMARSASMGDAVASGEVEMRSFVTIVFDIAPLP